MMQLQMLSAQKKRASIISQDIVPNPQLCEMLQITPNLQNSKYLESLLDSDFNTLLDQPKLLVKESLSFAIDLEQLICTEYKAFIDAYQHANEMKSSLKKYPKHLETLLSQLPAFKIQLKELHDHHKTYSEQRQMLESVKKHHYTLTELIEIPSLFDTLIRNGYYEESMDLQLFVQRLVMKHPSIVLFQQIQGQCTKSATMMLTQITNLLRGPVKLPLLIRVVGYLRRIKDLDETQLAVCFLQQRNIFLESLLSDIQEPDVQGYLRKLIETTRM